MGQINSEPYNHWSLATATGMSQAWHIIVIFKVNKR